MKQYQVTGMSCAACSARVEKAVRSVPGVKECAVSLLTFRQEPEVWAWLTTPDGTHIPVTHWESLVGRGAGCGFCAVCRM